MNGLIKKIISTLVILSIGLYFITENYEIILIEYNLITNQKSTTKGQIIEVEESSYDVDGSETGQGSGTVYKYVYKYSFNVNGNNISAFGLTTGEPPFNMDLEEIPYEVEVEYLPKNPRKYSRIKDVEDVTTSLAEWFKKRMVLRVLGLILMFYLIYKYWKDELE